MDWFAVQIDRDFETNLYGNGIRLYIDDFDTNYKIINGYSYDGTILQVKDEKGAIITLNNEPNNIKFTNTLHKKWKNWDEKYGSLYDENRYDYEPWAIDSLNSLAIELGIIDFDKNESIEIYYKVNKS